MIEVKTEFEFPDYVFDTKFSYVTLSRITEEISIQVGAGYEESGAWISPTLAREIAAQLIKLADAIEGK